MSTRYSNNASEPRVVWYTCRAETHAHTEKKTLNTQTVIHKFIITYENKLTYGPLSMYIQTHLSHPSLTNTDTHLQQITTPQTHLHPLPYRQTLPPSIHLLPSSLSPFSLILLPRTPLTRQKQPKGKRGRAASFHPQELMVVTSWLLARSHFH